ncbi:MAG: multidrug efflux SMR transporter [Pelistega sp.]|nr:multidrug efflux SMR transporter [Pelistega sp.]
MAWLYLGLAIVAEIIATSALQATQGFTKLWPSVLTLLGYGLAFYFLSLTLRSIPLGIAYAIWSGVGIVCVSIIAYFLYKQSLDLPAVLGMSMIVGGVVIINLFSKTVGH